MNRADFLKTSSLGLAAMAASSPASAQPAASVPNAGVPVLFFCPRWGSEALPPAEFCKKVKDAGYDGVEMVFPENGQEQATWRGLLADHGLKVITLQVQANADNVGENLKEFEKFLRIAATAKPLFINSHTGRDFFTFEENSRVIRRAFELEKELGVPVYHEIHRGKFSFHSGPTVQMLDAFPDLKLVADLSHWCCVSESLLGEKPQQARLDKVLPRCFHLHARVGFPEGPQVNDPRAPEWEAALSAHLGWWDRIIAQRRAAGMPFATISPEFGPPAYLPTLPFTRQPVADQWAINKHMMDLLRKRYNA